MKGLIGGRAGVGLLETTKPKSVMAGIRHRGRWDIIGFSRDKGKLGIQVKKDVMVDGCEPVKLELCNLGSEPFGESDFVVVEVGLLEDIEDPLTLLCVCQWVVDMTGNGGLM